MMIEQLIEKCKLQLILKSADNIIVSALYLTTTPTEDAIVDFGDGTIEHIRPEPFYGVYMYNIFHHYNTLDKFVVDIILPVGLENISIEGNMIEFNHENIETVKAVGFGNNQAIKVPFDIKSFVNLEALEYYSCNNLTEPPTIENNKTIRYFQMTANTSLVKPPIMTNASSLSQFMTDENPNLLAVSDFTGCVNLASVIADTGGLTSEFVNQCMLQLMDVDMFPKLGNLDLHNNTPLAPPSPEVKSMFIEKRPDVELFVDDFENGISVHPVGFKPSFS